jgi:hypothetical protein
MESDFDSVYPVMRSDIADGAGAFNGCDMYYKEEDYLELLAAYKELKFRMEGLEK